MKKTLLSLLALSPLFGWAHEGHGRTQGNTFLHYIAEPEHAVVVLLVVAAVAFSVIAFLRTKKAKE